MWILSFSERNLEDHEIVYHIYRSWGNTEGNKFFFKKDYRKYELFQNPNVSTSIKRFKCRPLKNIKVLGRARINFKGRITLNIGAMKIKMPPHQHLVGKINKNLPWYFIWPFCDAHFNTFFCQFPSYSYIVLLIFAAILPFKYGGFRIYSRCFPRNSVYWPRTL